MFRLATAGFAALIAAPALADCPAPDAMYAAADAWIAGERLPDPDVTSMDDGACAYQHFREGLEDPLGAPVGVKIGFTRNPRKRHSAFPAPSPVRCSGR